MEDKTKLTLTAAEMSQLWAQYINDSASICILKQFTNTVQDQEVKVLVESTMEACLAHIMTLKEMFIAEQFPIPFGFTDKDVNLNSPKLFSDTFMLRYLSQLTLMVLAASSAAIGLSTRPDTIKFHEKVWRDAFHLNDRIKKTMLNQGVFVKSPWIPAPDQASFVQSQNFLGKLMGKQRPLTSIEITHLYVNIQTNNIGRDLIIGFSQVAKRKKVIDYLIRGKNIAEKHVEGFQKILTSADLSAPMLWDTSVTHSTSPTFSDKLMLFHVSAMIAAGIGNYGMAISASPRKDIAGHYASLLPDITLYAEDGANLLIDHGWLEEPPEAEDREKLARNKQ